MYRELYHRLLVVGEYVGKQFSKTRMKNAKLNRIISVSCTKFLQKLRAVKVQLAFLNCKALKPEK